MEVYVVETLDDEGYLEGVFSTPPKALRFALRGLRIPAPTRRELLAELAIDSYTEVAGRSITAVTVDSEEAW